MALNFPANPTNGDTYVEGSTTWQYDGTVWNLVGSQSAVTIPNQFNTVAVSGEDDVVADSAADTLNLVAGSNITLTTDATTDSVTIAAAGGQAGETNQNAFSNVAVSGQTTVEADSTTDTLTLAAGSNITLTTDASTDTVTIASTGGSGSVAFSDLTDQPSGITIDEIAFPAITKLVVGNSGATGYTFDQYTGSNPTIYAISGTTIAFNLQISGHPFLIQDGQGNNYNTGLIHVSSAGAVLEGANAQGQTNGTLYWKVPYGISGGYRYQCDVHSAMVGAITVKGFNAI